MFRCMFSIEYNNCEMLWFYTEWTKDCKIFTSQSAGPILLKQRNFEISTTAAVMGVLLKSRAVQV